MVAFGGGRMNRRRFFVLLGMLFGVGWASPGEPKKRDDEKDKKEKEKEKDKDDKDDKERKEREPKDFFTRIYGQVLAAHRGQLKVGAYVLQGDSPWLSWVAPGMWVEAEGRKAGERFVVQRLRILKPERFAYYRGPGAPVEVRLPFVEAWYGSGEKTPFFLQAAPPGEDVLLVAHAEDWGILPLPLGLARLDGEVIRGRGILPLPLGLAPPAPPGPDWFLAVGRWEGGRIRWLKLEALER